MIPRKLINDHADALRGLSAAARAEFADVWVVLDKDDPVKLREALCTYVPKLVEKYGALAQVCGMEFYERCRAVEVPGEDYAAVGVELEDPYDRVRWACRYLFEDGGDGEK